MTDFGGFDPPTGPPAGWYPDPFDPAHERYWDGRTWDMTPHGSGAPTSDDYPDVGNWLDRSFKSAYRRWRAVLPLAVVTSLLPTVFGFFALDRLVEGLVIVDDEVEGWTSDRLPFVFTYFGLALFLTAVGTMALTRLMLDTVDGESPTSTGGELMASVRATIAACVAFPRVLGWSLLILAGVFVVAVATTILAVAVPVLGIVLLLTAIPVVIWLAVRWAFLLVAMIDRRGEPFSRSSRVSDRRWWHTLGRLVLLGILVWLISFAIQLAATAVTGGEFSALSTDSSFQFEDGSSDPVVLDDELDLGTGVIALSALVSTIGTVLASSVVASGTALLYRTRNRRQ